MAVGVKPTFPGYEPDDLGLLAISAYSLYHIFYLFAIASDHIPRPWVLVLPDHIFRSVALGLTTFVFSLSVFFLRLLPPSWCVDRFLGDHIFVFEVRVLTTFLTIVRCGLHGNSSTREHENVLFGWQNSTKKHYLALEKHKNRSWGKVDIIRLLWTKEAFWTNYN